MPKPEPQPVAPPVTPVVKDTTQAPDETGGAPPAQQPTAARGADDQSTQVSAQPPARAPADPSSVFNSSRPVLPPGVGPYTVLALLGEGGMGVVYRVRHLLMDREFALKVIRSKYYADPLARERFVREINSAFKISSDYVVRCSYADYDNGAPYLVMELLEGDTLVKWAQAEPNRRTAENALRFAADLFRGLAAIHDEKLVHRDIKPGNLWVDKAGRLKVFDLGLARRYDQDSATEYFVPSKPGEPPLVIGTPRYMAPEQASGEPLDARADLFAAGVVLYWFCAGNSPFEREDIASELAAVRTFEPEALAKAKGMPAGLSELVRKLLSKDKKARPVDARAALAEVEKVLAAQNAPQTVLLGREQLFADALKALGAGGVVALSGEGGMGKTYVARALEKAHADAGGTAVWVDCAAAGRFEAVVREAAAQLFAERCDTEPLEPLAVRVAEQFAKRGALLVLDNFEVLAGDPSATVWLRKFRAPARALCVGRSIPIELPGAQFRVNELKREHAVALFRERAANLAGVSDATVRDLCAAVGDHPLAIELLAKRTRLVPADVLLARVLNGLAALSGGTLSGFRHTSIRACFAESLRGLSPGAREHLLALSVLPAPFGSTLMTVVVGTDDGGVAAEELVGASLWRLDGARYSVHPLVRQVAREEQGNTRAEYERRAAERVAGRVRAVRELLRTSGDRATTKDYLDRCETELPNILAVAAGAHAITIAEALSAFWGARGHWDTAARLYATAADAARALADPVSEAWCREFRGYIFRHLGRYEDAEREYRAALDLCDAHLAAKAKHYGRVVTRYGKLCSVRCRYDDAVSHLTAGREWFRAARDREGELNALTYLGQARKFQGDLTSAEALFREALAGAREAKNEHRECEARFQLGNTLLRQDRAAEATEQLQHSLRLARAADDRVRESQVLVDLGIVAAHARNWAEAEPLLTGGLQIARAMGLRMYEGRAMRRLAEFHLARGANYDLARALELARGALAILADSEDAWAADRARETVRRAEAAL